MTAQQLEHLGVWQPLRHEAAAALRALGAPERVEHRLLGGVDRRTEQQVEGLGRDTRPDRLAAGGAALVEKARKISPLP